MLSHCHSESIKIKCSFMHLEMAYVKGIERRREET
jgi:hypothetical protein